MTQRYNTLAESLIADVKLERVGFTKDSSFFELPTEPNFGPFPQYNIIVEDSPMENLGDIIGPKDRRKYKSNLEVVLTNLLAEANHEYTRLQTVVMNPRRLFDTDIPGREAINTLRTKMNPFSLAQQSDYPTIPGKNAIFQDHEQFIEENILPFQEITVHPESAVPEGSQAYDSKSPMNLLDINGTADYFEMGLLLVDETIQEKRLSFCASYLVPKPTKPPIVQ